MAHEFLSPEGRVRKIAMRMSLEDAVVHRHTMKKRLRGGAVAAVLLLLGWLLWPAGFTLPDRPENDVVHDRLPVVPTYTHFKYKFVLGDREEVDKWIVVGGDASKYHVRDDELLKLLEQAGHRSGIMRLGDKVILTQPLLAEVSD